MTKQRSFKRSLAKSILSVTLCAGMLVGSTYAWFSDEAKTQTNTITAGNLDVELLVDTTGEGNFEDATNQTLFESTQLEKIEPGVMLVSKPFQVKNVGNLWLNYTLKVTVGETPYTWTNEKFDNATVKLSEVVKMAVVSKDDYDSAIAVAKLTGEDATYEQRETAWKAMLKETEAKTIQEFNENNDLEPDKTNNEKGEVIVLFWEADPSVELTNPDNKYNVPNHLLAIDSFSLDVFATQTPNEGEKDSFGPNYDAGAKEAAAITAVFEEKVVGLKDELHDILKNVNESYKDAIDVELNTENGNVTATFSFKDAFKAQAANPGNVGNDDTKAMSSAFTATASKIAETLMAEKENLSTLTIKGKGEKTVDFAKDASDELALRNALGSALLAAVANPLVDGNSIDLTVDVVTKSGATVSYDLKFDFEDSEVIGSGRIGVGYVAALMRALQDWEKDGEVHDGTWTL